LNNNHNTDITLNPDIFREEYYREIFDCISDAIFVMSTLSGKIIDVNNSMLRMYGYKKKEVIGFTIGKFSSGNSPYRQEDALFFIEKAQVNGPQVFEWEAKRENGTLFWVEVNLRYSLMENGDKLIAVVRDITERKKNQDRKIQNEKLMSVGGLAAGIAHEINNPLAGMMQIANVMANRLCTQSLNSSSSLKAAEESGTTIDAIEKYMSKRDIPEMIDQINNSGQRVASIVNNILSYSYKVDSISTHFDITDLLDKTVELVRLNEDLAKEYNLKTLQIKKEYEPNLKLLLCNGKKLQQAFLNIFINGIQAMGDAQTKQPQFTIKVNYSQDKESLEIIISDNGPGVEQEIRNRIFEPFYSTKTVGSGLGLGLSTAYFIIKENHNGMLRLLPGTKGAEFFITLPL